MEIVLSRVDDRLLHGQVATSWVRTFTPQVIVVVDEKLPDNKVQVQILKVAAPPGTKVYVMKPEKLTQKIKAGVLNNYKVMFIFAGLEAPKYMIDNGVPIKSLNIGGMRFQEGRERLSKTISMTPEEKKIAKELIDKGIELEHRQVVTDNKLPVSKILAGEEK